MLNFLKKNGYYILAGVCVICIGVMIAMSVNYSQMYEELRRGDKTPTPTVAPTKAPTQAPTQAPTPTSKPVDNQPLTFTVPVANATIGEDFAIDSFVFSDTLNQWQAHTGIDFITEEAADVVAAADGEIVAVITDNVLDGNTVVIDHGNNLKTYYKSLAAEIPVSVGDVVKAGDTIGKTSLSSYSEFKEGCHVHFEMTLSDEIVNPNDYFGAEK